MNLKASGSGTNNEEKNAFEKIFREYYQPLCRFSYSIVKDMDTAEEIVQDFFFHFWEDKQSANVRISLRSYFYKSVYNNSLKHLRKQLVRQKFAASHTETNPTIEGSIIENMEAKELARLVEQILNSLPERCSTIFRMSRFDGLKYHEIATVLSVSIKTVEANMGKALAVFRKKLRHYKEFSGN